MRCSPGGERRGAPVPMRTAWRRCRHSARTGAGVWDSQPLPPTHAVHMPAVIESSVNDHVRNTTSAAMRQSSAGAGQAGGRGSRPGRPPGAWQRSRVHAAERPRRGVAKLAAHAGLGATHPSPGDLRGPPCRRRQPKGTGAWPARRPWPQRAGTRTQRGRPSAPPFAAKAWCRSAVRPAPRTPPRPAEWPRPRRALVQPCCPKPPGQHGHPQWGAHCSRCPQTWAAGWGSGGARWAARRSEPAGSSRAGRGPGRASPGCEPWCDV